MTPTVCKSVAMFPERAAEYKWFDLGALPEGREFVHEEVVNILLQPLPFDRCAVTGLDEDGYTFAMLVTRDMVDDGDRAIRVETAVEDNASPRVVYNPPFRMIADPISTEQGLEITFNDTKFNTDEQALAATRVSAMVVAVFLENVHKQHDKYKVFTAIPHKSNAKRVRQGKMPLFDWHTVMIQPPTQHLPHQGGSHTSPRQHDVRGHWVTRNGKRFWRRAHKRGDASLGTVFHDYKMAEAV